VDAEIRDAKAAYWPNFLSGKPVSGSLAYSAAGPKTDKIVVECPTFCQVRGDQSRRVIGELIKDPSAPPKLTFTLTSLGAPKSAEKKETDDRGRESVRALESCDGKGTVEIAGKKVDVAPKCSVKYGKVTEKDIDKVTLSAYFTVKGKDLGLSGVLANEEVDFRITCQGMSQGSAPAAKKK
jgi:hypothetical protein